MHQSGRTQSKEKSGGGLFRGVFEVFIRVYSLESEDRCPEQESFRRHFSVKSVYSFCVNFPRKAFVGKEAHTSHEANVGIFYDSCNRPNLSKILPFIHVDIKKCIGI